MRSIIGEISNRVRQAMMHIRADGDPQVRIAQDDKFGDYQCNCALGLAKSLGRKPREVAEELIGRLAIDDICEPPEVAGPGFINLRLKPSFLADELRRIPRCDDKDDRLGIARVEQTETVVVDFASPNLAKEMHIGHVRSAVIGECVSRILEFAGHTVHRENHVGDWGTQFGMLVAFLRHERPDVVDKPDDLIISDMEQFYVAAKARFDADDAFRRESRETVVALQGGDPVTRRLWKAFCDESLRHCHAVFHRLDITLTDRGESYYADLMDEVIRRLEALRDRQGADYIRESDGALCIFLDGFTTREGEPLPMIVRKSDGGFNYSTSDLATILHRIESLGATHIVYVVGISQKQHFEMLFAAARKIGMVGPHVSLNHLGFGNLLSKTGAPFKTREGGTVKLKTILDEAVSRAEQVVRAQSVEESEDESKRSFNEEQIRDIAEAVGTGAIKYFDLCHSLTADYKFDVDTMCALEGNTAPYMMYAYARIRSIGRKAGIDYADLMYDGPIDLNHAAEIALAKKLLQFREVYDTIRGTLQPNLLTDYLFDLAKAFSRFYSKKLGVRVIDATPDHVRNSRLRLCDLTARTLKLGLRLLGIRTLERM